MLLRIAEMTCPMLLMHAAAAATASLTLAWYPALQRTQDQFAAARQQCMQGQ